MSFIANIPRPKSKLAFLIPYTPAEIRRHRAFSKRHPDKAVVKGFAEPPKVYNEKLEIWVGFFWEEEETISNVLITQAYWDLYGFWLVKYCDELGVKFYRTRRGDIVMKWIDREHKHDPQQDVVVGTICRTDYSKTPAIIIAFNPNGLRFFQWDVEAEHPLYELRYLSPNGGVCCEGPPALLTRGEFQEIQATPITAMSSRVVALESENEDLRQQLQELEELSMDHFQEKLSLFINDISSKMKGQRKAARREFTISHGFTIAFVESFVLAKLEKLRIPIRQARNSPAFEASITTVQQAKRLFPGATWSLSKSDGSRLVIQLPIGLEYTKRRRKWLLSLTIRVSEVNPSGATFSANM